jgi:hypothetical protein
MSYNFFINHTIPIEQNTNLAAQNFPITTSSYDYILDINVQGINGSSLEPFNGNYSAETALTMNNLFVTRTYTQSTTNSEQYNTNLQANNSAISSILVGSGAVNIISTNTAINSTTAYASFRTNASFGNRLLEIVATKIFGNPLTTAAITNDTAFTNSTGLVSGAGVNPTDTVTFGFYNTLNTYKNEFFNQYVASDRIQSDQNEAYANGPNVENKAGDYNTVFNYNLASSHIDVPLLLNGVAKDAGGNNISCAFLQLMNGPTTVGGSLFAYGSYSIPLLLRLHD